MAMEKMLLMTNANILVSFRIKNTHNWNCYGYFFYERNSASVKRDAVGYTPEAERLKERRDRRFNAREERRIKMREIESNEKVKIRQAEAIENAADNQGNLLIW